MAPEDSPTLEPPKGPSEDPGAHDLSSDSDDHFSDAQSGLSSAEHSPNVIGNSTVLVVNTQNETAGRLGSEDYSATPGGLPVPKTVVEKVDPENPSHGEVPGTLAHEKRLADAIPDEIVTDEHPSSADASESQPNPTDLPIPTTIVEKVTADPSHGEVPGTDSFEKRKGDAEPDLVKVKNRESPTFPRVRSPNIGHTRRKSSGVGRKSSVSTAGYAQGADGEEEFGDDFDDFEEGEEDADFGDFDDGFQEPVAAAPQPVPVTPSFPVLDFENLHSQEDIRSATDPYMNLLFPADIIDTSILPPLTASNPIFLTPRSASLWSQLVAPPPLQPPNWIRSRIRRLFLVSLGVPVDLDEILPASKQKKLVLPSINLRSPASSGSPRDSSDNITRLKKTNSNASTTSVDSQGNKRTRSESRRRKGPPPAPHLDLVSARQICSITDEALAGFTIEELKEHVKRLEAMQGKAQEVLEYWTKRCDEKIGDREAFEGVIENLVKHARKVRK